MTRVRTLLESRHAVITAAIGILAVLTAASPAIWATSYGSRGKTGIRAGSIGGKAATKDPVDTRLRALEESTGRMELRLRAIEESLGDGEPDPGPSDPSTNAARVRCDDHEVVTDRQQHDGAKATCHVDLGAPRQLVSVVARYKTRDLDWSGQDKDGIHSLGLLGVWLGRIDRLSGKPLPEWRKCLVFVPARGAAERHPASPCTLLAAS